MEAAARNAAHEIRERPLKTRKSERATRNGEAMVASPYEPERVEIAAQEGRPFVVRLKKRPVLVRDVVNMWRIDEAWWRRPVSRLYFQLEMDNDARITVFRDLLGGAWYRQHWA
jgi:hypothetical protein